MTKLFAVGFPRDFDEIQLAQLFGPFGDIELLTILRDKITGRSKGFGFIDMKTESGAIDAIEGLNGKVFGERQMEVRVADEKKTAPKPPFHKSATRNNTVAPEKKKRPRINK